MGALQRISLKINGSEHSRDVEPRLLLVHFLRDVLGLTGTHIGCDTSSCGACTVMLDNMAVKSCTVLAVQADGAELLTIEGLAQGDNLHPLQEAFWECHGLQCGFLHAGNDSFRISTSAAQSEAQRAGDSPCDRRQPLPLHRL